MAKEKNYGEGGGGSPICGRFGICANQQRARL